MKKIVVRKPDAVDAIPGSRRPSGRPARPRRPSYRPEESSSPALGLAVAAIIIVVIVVLIASAKRPSAPTPVARAVAPQTATAESEPKKWSELEGKTMAEWMREHNKDNPELKERQERLRRFRSGHTNS